LKTRNPIIKKYGEGVGDLKMKTKSLKILVLMTALAIFVAPVLAIPGGNGPKFLKYVASLEFGTRFGQVIYNTNPEDDDSYELEDEVEDSSMTDETVDVFLNGVDIGDIYLDEDGNGKATFYVASDPAGSTITVEGSITLTSGEWRLWAKGPGPK
jgi:hypothetical protein